MFGINDLEDIKIKCPVKGCKTRINNLMTRPHLKKLESYLKGNEQDVDFEQYRCKEHNIYITPTKFLYKYYEDNLLWCDENDKAILEKIKEKKRFWSQFHYFNSEDATVWNVFRFLENMGYLNDYLTQVSGFPVKTSEVIYWSYSHNENDTWERLKNVNRVFKDRTEPDIIVKSDDALYFIEAKLGASNSNFKIKKIGRFDVGKIFLKEPLQKISEDGYSQLARLWIIGSWIAKNDSNIKNFFLLNLVRDSDEINIVSNFGNSIEQNENYKFIRIIWEDVYSYISKKIPSSDNKTKILKYFENKAFYDGTELTRAFNIQKP